MLKMPLVGSSLAFFLSRPSCLYKGAGIPSPDILLKCAFCHTNFIRSVQLLTTSHIIKVILLKLIM